MLMKLVMVFKLLSAIRKTFKNNAKIETVLGTIS